MVSSLTIGVAYSRTNSTGVEYLLYLSNADVKGTLELDRAMTVTADAYRQFYLGGVTPFPPQTLGVRDDAVRLSGGVIVKENGVGLRLSKSGYGGSIAILFRVDNGEVLSIMGFSNYGTMRTAALMGVAVSQLAPTESSTLAMVGTGRNAPGYLKAASLVRPIKQIKVFSRNAQSRTEFTERLQKELDTPIEAVNSRDEATKDADIVFVSTNSPDSVIEAESLAPHAFLASMGRPRELGASIYQTADLIVVPQRPVLEPIVPSVEQSQLEELGRSGDIAWDRVVELGAVIDADTPPGTQGTGITVFREFQTGFGDVALCLEIYRQCVARNLGTELPL